MSLANANAFILVLIVLSRAVLEEGATVPVPVPTNDAELSMFPKITVEIFNQLPDNAIFKIHCKSADDDLGVQVVQPGQSYSFRFRLNLSRRTLFFCGVTWQGGWAEFDIYKGYRDKIKRRCDTYCRWEVQTYYVVGYKSKKNIKVADLFFPWKTKCC